MEKMGKKGKLKIKKDKVEKTGLTKNIAGILFHNSTGFIAQGSYTAQPVKTIIL